MPGPISNPVPPPTRVALYACIHDDANPATVMTALRETADANGWEVVASLYDTGPLSRPPGARLAWRTVTQLASTHRIEGVIAPDRHHVNPTELATRDAFTAYRAISPTPSHRHRYRTTLPATPTSVREARHTLTAHLRDWNLPHVTPTAELILSELLTNAVRHTDSHTLTVTVTVTHARDRLRLAVTDASTTRPRITPPTPEAEQGRGLALVSALATRWGCTPARGGAGARAGKTVWATLPTIE